MIVTVKKQGSCCYLECQCWITVKNLVHVITYEYFPQTWIFTELELNQTKPQLTFSENQKETKTHCQNVNCHALQSLLFLSEADLRHRRFLVICSFITNSVKISFCWDKISDLRVEAVIFYIVPKINNKQVNLVYS